MPQKTLLRYCGGKSRASRIIADYFPFHLKELCSPFFGGGSVEFELASRGVKIWGYDNFHCLVLFWKTVKNEPEMLVRTIEMFYPLSGPEDFYSFQKKLIEFEEKQNHTIMTATLFFILNRCSFSGTTLSGGASTGHPRFTRNSIEKIRSFDMRNVSVEKMDFVDSIPLHGDKWLYCDPPYALKKSNLYGIKGNLHKDFDHQKLNQLLLTRDNWILSYNDCEFVRDMYGSCKILTPEWKYGMSKNKTSKEVLIMPERQWRCL